MGDDQVVGYRYYVGMHIGLCQGPVDQLIKINVDDREAWTGPIETGRLLVSRGDLFGGEEREGGVIGEVDFLPGYSDQGQNDYLLSKVSPDLLPCFRGVSTVVLRHMYIGMNPYMKKWSFKVSRIHKAQNGVLQWYDVKAEVPSVMEETTVAENSYWDYQIIDGNADISTQEAIDALVIPTANYISALAPFGRVASGLTIGAQGIPIYQPDFFPVVPINTLWHYDTTLWLRKNLQVPESGVISISGHVESNAIFFINGQHFASVNADNTLPETETGHAYTVSTAGITLIPGENCTLNVLAKDAGDLTDFVYNPGNGEQDPESLESQHARYLYDQDSSYFYGVVDAYTTHTSGDMNPAHIIRECLTNSEWGMGVDPIELDDDSFIAAADTLYDEKMGISLLWNNQTSIGEFISEICRYIEADLAVDNTTGKFRLKLIRADYDVATLPILDPDTISSVVDFHRLTTAELVNEVVVEYVDGTLNTPKTVTVQNIAMAQIQGTPVTSKRDYLGFSNSLIAAKVAARDLRSLSFPRASCTLYVNRTAAQFNKGSVFKLSWPDYNIVSMIMRVVAIDLGDGVSSKIRIDCTQDTFSLPEVSFVVEPDILWDDVKADPVPVQLRVALEMPYFALVKQLGQPAIDSTLATYPETGYMGATGVRPSGASVNMKLHTDSGAGYVEYGLVDFCPSALSVNAIGYNDTVIAITDTSDVDFVLTGTWAQIDNELVAIVAVSSTSITVKRGILDTVPATHAANARIYFWDNYAGTDSQQYVDTDTVDAKLQPLTTVGSLDLAFVLIDTITMHKRAIKPYPPGNLRINGQLLPASIAQYENLAFTWAHRDRTQQTAGLIGFDEGDIGPEVGTTYNMRLYNEAGTLLRTVSGVDNFFWYPIDQQVIDKGGSATVDPLWSSTILLLSMNGEDGSTTFTDSSETPKAITRLGDAHISTSSSKYSGSSAYFDGVGDYIYAAGTAVLLADFSIEFWVMKDTVIGVDSEMMVGWLTDLTINWGITNKVGMYFHATAENIEGATTLSLSTWNHIAVTRQSGVFKLYVNGVWDATHTVAQNIDYANLHLGTDAGVVRSFKGYIDDLRLISGTSAYSSAFTPPSAHKKFILSGDTTSPLRIELESVRDGHVSMQKHSLTITRQA